MSVFIRAAVLVKFLKIKKQDAANLIILFRAVFKMKFGKSCLIIKYYYFYRA
jgi:hypothetical protein